MFVHPLTKRRMFLRKIKYFTGGLIAVLLFTNSYVFSQNSTDYKKKKFTFHIEKLDTSASFDVFAVNPKIKADENAAYSWYSDGKILETKGGFSGRLLDGRYVSYYGNKNLRDRGIYLKGLKKGKWIKWHSNGKINEIACWKMGAKKGKYTLYNDMGQRMLTAHFKHDKLNGRMTTYEKDKVLLKMKYRNGQEVIPKIPKGKTKPTSTSEKKDRPSFFRSIFKKNEKVKTPPKEKEKKKQSISNSSPK